MQIRHRFIEDSAAEGSVDVFILDRTFNDIQEKHNEILRYLATVMGSDGGFSTQRLGKRHFHPETGLFGIGDGIDPVGLGDLFGGLFVGTTDWGDPVTCGLFSDRISHTFFTTYHGGSF